MHKRWRVFAAAGLALSSLAASAAPESKVPQWMVGKWKGANRIGPPEDGINEEILVDCGENGEFSATSRLTYTDPQGQVQILDERSGQVTTGTWSISDVDDKRFRMKAKVKGGEKEHQSAIERVDKDTLRDESGFTLRRAER